MLHDIKTKVDKQVKSQTNTANITNTTNIDKPIQNDTQNEISNEVQNVIEENTVIQNTITNNTVKNTTTFNTTNTTSSNYKPASTDKKQEAINLVKQDWGTDNTVSFSFEYINENGEYVVSVKDKATATVKYYFRVNIETGEVELD